MILGIDASQANRKIRSGTEWYAFHLIQEFKKLLNGRDDVEVRLYTRDLLQADLAANLPENFRVRILRWPLRYFWGQIRLSWEMLANPPDVLFCPAHTIPLTSILSRKGRGRTRVFTTLHDVGFEDYPELYDKLSLWYHKLAARLAIKKAHRIFTVSEFSKERIVENFNYPADKITVTYLGVDKNMPIDIKLSNLKKYDLEEKGYILYVGRLEPKKNVLNIIKAYEMYLSSLRATEESAAISGIASSSLRSHFGGVGSLTPRNDGLFDLALAGPKVNTQDADEYLSDKLDLKKRIKFLNYVAEEDKWTLLSGAAVFLFPTLYEGFGLPILEAQATKTPVVTSNTASNPEIAGGGAVLVNPDSPYEIAQAVKELINNDGLRQEKINLGLENIKRFAWEDTAKKTLECLMR